MAAEAEAASAGRGSSRRRHSLSQSGRSAMGLSRGSVGSISSGRIPVLRTPGVSDTYSGRQTPGQQRGRKDREFSREKIEDGWYPHMGTMPAPILSGRTRYGGRRA